MNIELWYTFGRQEPDYNNDMHAYGINLITRVLLDLAANQGIREGDATFIMAYHKTMVLYMLNTRDAQVYLQIYMTVLCLYLWLINIFHTTVATL